MGKRAKPEEVIAKLREIEIRLARGETAAAAARAVGVTEQSYYRWRGIHPQTHLKDYTGTDSDETDQPFRIRLTKHSTGIDSTDLHLDFEMGFRLRGLFSK